MEFDHIIWDWNGTLIDDTGVVVLAVNKILSDLGAEPVTVDWYKDNYSRPIMTFYEQLLGRPLTEAEMSVESTRFLATYDTNVEQADLHDGVEETLVAVRAAGKSQSLLSMYPHDALVPQVQSRRIDHHFAHIDGTMAHHTDFKHDRITDHLEVVGVTDPGRVLLVGDIDDDAAAARANGLHCVLVAGGVQSRAVLERTGEVVLNSVKEVQDLLASSRAR